MKSLAIATTLFFCSTLAVADEASKRKLVDQLMASSGFQEGIEGQIDAYMEMIPSGSSESAKKRWRDLANKTMGWDAIKDGLADLISKTYTEAELSAELHYLESPEGKSAKSKVRQFEHDYALLLADKAKSAAGLGTGSERAQFEAGGSTSSDIVATNVEEHTNGGQTYFTGSLENRGKEAVQHAQVEINLFQDGKFVDQYSTYVSGSVVPGTPRYFKVACGCRDSPPASHNTFKVSESASGRHCAKSLISANRLPLGPVLTGLEVRSGS
jgi:hypothetical protein